MAQRDPDQIEGEIQQTQEQMRDTIAELQTRLTPLHLKDLATEKVRRLTVDKVEGLADDATRTMKGASADVFDTVKQNPLPAALVALGLGWLFMESRNQRRWQPEPRVTAVPAEYDYDRDYGQSDFAGYEHGGPAYQGVREPQSRAQGATRQVQDKAQQVASSAQDTAQQVASNVQDTAQQVASTVQDKAQQLGDQAQEWAATAQERAYRARSRFEDMMDENPLVIGAAAVVLGAAIGMSLPVTPQEDQMLGPQRDKLMDKAQATASDAMEKVQQVAERAGAAAKEAVRDEAQKQNLSA